MSAVIQSSFLVATRADQHESQVIVSMPVIWLRNMHVKAAGRVQDCVVCWNTTWLRWCYETWLKERPQMLETPARLDLLACCTQCIRILAALESTRIKWAEKGYAKSNILEVKVTFHKIDGLPLAQVKECTRHKQPYLLICHILTRGSWGRDGLWSRIWRRRCSGRWSSTTLDANRRVSGTSVAGFHLSDNIRNVENDQVLYQGWHKFL